MSIASPTRAADERRRIIVKVGSAVLAPEGLLSRGRVALIASQVAGARTNARTEVVLVSSGAVAAGLHPLGLREPPRTIVGKQAAAAVGQPRLIRAYAEALAPFGLEVAQVLLTAEDVRDRTRFLNARRTLESLLDAGIVPIVNENDSVAYDEIRFGDNDRLSAHVAHLIDAELLVLLSQADGVRTQGGTGELVPIIDDIPSAWAHVGRGGTRVGTGGMATKLEAAGIASGSGVEVVIASGLEPDAVARALAREPVGTRFPVRAAAPEARKRWIGYSTRVTGRVRVDEGAVRALTERGASLLPGGILAVEGAFDRGAAVEVVGPDGSTIARGLTGYSGAELDKIKGLKSTDIERTLGVSYSEEVIHRDDLFVFTPRPASPARVPPERTP